MIFDIFDLVSSIDSGAERRKPPKIVDFPDLVEVVSRHVFEV